MAYESQLDTVVEYDILKSDIFLQTVTGSEKYLSLVVVQVSWQQQQVLSVQEQAS